MPFCIPKPGYILTMEYGFDIIRCCVPSWKVEEPRIHKKYAPNKSERIFLLTPCLSA